MNTLTVRILLVILFICKTAISTSAQDPIEGFWYDKNRNAKIQIFRGDDNRFYGKVAWLRNPLWNGKPKVDQINPDPENRDQPILGLMILRGFTRDGGEYEEGTVYDPRSGKTYSCKMKLAGDKLEVRGYIGMSLFGKSTSFTRAEQAD